jgi:hypothetical protein
LKLRLHLQSAHDKALLTQRSFDHSESIKKSMNDETRSTTDRSSRQSMINLSAIKSNLRDKPRLPMIRDRTTSNIALSKLGSTIEQNQTKVSTHVLESRIRKSMKKRGRRSIDTYAACALNIAICRRVFVSLFLSRFV